MRCLVLIAALFITAGHAASVADFPVGSAVETYHGISVPDPYRGLEDLKDPKVLAWYRAQNQYARQTLDALPGKAALQARIGELLRAKPVVTGYLQKDATGGIWYFRRAGEEQNFSLYRRASETAAEQAVIKPAQFNRDGRQAQIMGYSPAHDGSKVVVTLAWDGDELHEEQRVVLHDGTVLPDVLQQVQGSDAVAEDHSQWLPDGSGFFYAKLKGAPQGKPDDYEDGELRLHRLGQPQSADILLMNRPSQPALALKPQEYPVPGIIAGSPYLFAWVQDGVGDARLFASDLKAALAGKPEWIALGKAAEYTVQGTVVTLLRKLKSPNGSLWQATLPAGESVQIVPEGKTVLTALRAAKNGVYVMALEASRNTLALLQSRRVSRQCIRASCPQMDYRLTPIALPLASNSAFVTHPQQPGVLLRLRDWNRASQNFAVYAQGQVKSLPWPAPGPYDAPAHLVVERIEVTSADGVQIPVAIVHDKALKRDGHAPLLIEGYSAYGQPTNAYLSPAMLAFYERGGVYAWVSARGSGDKGRAWHLGGKGALKPNTWRDVIAATEWLHAQGYSTPARTTVTGTSAGGILMGGAITERPELFGGAIGHVPAADMLGFARSSNGPPNFPEFGDPAKFDEFAALLQMSPYHRVQKGVAYPAVLLTTGLNDKRVESWIVAKLYARLAASTSSGQPVLMTVDESDGHFGVSLDTQTASSADVIAFALSRKP